MVNYNITIQFAYKILTLVALKRWLHAYVTVGKYQVQSLPVDFSVAIYFVNEIEMSSAL